MSDFWIFNDIQTLDSENQLHFNQKLASQFFNWSKFESC